MPHQYSSLDEDRPLLDLIQESQDDPNQTHTLPQTPQSLPKWHTTSPSNVILLISLAMFTIVTSGMMMMMPIYRLIEDALCHVYYDDPSSDLIEEMKCKVDEVQSPLAYLMGWLGLLNAIINFLVAFPYGIISDKSGRKPVILMAYTGIATSFCMTPLMMSSLGEMVRQNPYMLMTGSLFTFVGGGVPVLMSTLYAVAADVSTEKNKASSFLYLAMGATGGALLGPLIAGVLMSRMGPWVPVYIVVCMIPVVYGLLILIPETIAADIQASKDESLIASMATGLTGLANSFQMLKEFNILLLLVPFLTTNPRMVAGMTTLPQYMSKRFGWTLADTSILLSPLGLLHLAVLGLVPNLSNILTGPRFGMTTFQKDLLLTRVFIFIIASTALIQALSPNVTMFLFGLTVSGFGSADGPLVRATISHFVNKRYTSRLYALISMADVLGSMIGGPVLAWFFNKGLRLRGVWTGLPWLYISVLCFLSLLSLAIVSRPSIWVEGDDSVIDEQEEEEEEVVEPAHPICLD